MKDKIVKVDSTEISILKKEQVLEIFNDYDFNNQMIENILRDFDNSIKSYSLKETQGLFNEMRRIIDKKFKDAIVRTSDIEEENDFSVMHYGGVSDIYRSRLEEKSNFNEWRYFWIMVKQYEQNNIKVPTFGWHTEHIKNYCFKVLNLDQSLFYLTQLKVKLVMEDYKMNEDAYKIQKEYLRELYDTINQLREERNKCQNQQN